MQGKSELHRRQDPDHTNVPWALTGIHHLGAQTQLLTVQSIRIDEYNTIENWIENTIGQALEIHGGKCGLAMDPNVDNKSMDSHLDECDYTVYDCTSCIRRTDCDSMTRTILDPENEGGHAVRFTLNPFSNQEVQFVCDNELPEGLLTSQDMGTNASKQLVTKGDLMIRSFNSHKAKTALLWTTLRPVGQNRVVHDAH